MDISKYNWRFWTLNFAWKALLEKFVKFVITVIFQNNFERLFPAIVSAVLN